MERSAYFNPSPQKAESGGNSGPRHPTPLAFQGSSAHSFAYIHSWTIKSLKDSPKGLFI